MSLTAPGGDVQGVEAGTQEDYVSWKLPESSDDDEDINIPLKLEIPPGMKDHRHPQSPEATVTTATADQNSILSQNSKCGLPSQADPAHSWPWSCKYFIPQVMDCETSRMLITRDASYLDDAQYSRQKLECIDLGGTNPRLKYVSFEAADDTELTDLLDSTSLPRQHTRVLSVQVNRIYHGGVRTRSYCGFRLTESTWLRVLDVAEIPPNAVELLHDRNGGHWSCTTYCPQDIASTTTTKLKGDAPCAYHMAVRLCKWLGKDHFLYARHDFHTGKNLILIAGSGQTFKMSRLLSQFPGGLRPHLFSVICAALTTWINEIRSIGWDLDFATQKLEAETGFSNRFFCDEPLPPDKLSLRKFLVATRENLYGARRASEIMRDIFTFLDAELSHNGTYRLHREHCQPQDEAVSLRLLESQLSRQLQQRAVQLGSQQGQLSSLIRRVDAQWQITTALISQHTTNLTIQMARDSRNDSILMRRIAFVTIIFLPPTFLATFFSMSFFRVSEGRLTVSRWIWLYVVCTLPLTIFLGLAYGDVGERSKQMLDRWHPKSWKNVKEKGESLG